jgi:hypothetical protein
MIGDATFAQEEWQPYQGAQGGKGWKNARTGEGAKLLNLGRWTKYFGLALEDCADIELATRAADLAVEEDGAFGMIRGEWHGPEPPGPDWVLVHEGKRGGKIWRQSMSPRTPAAQPKPAKRKRASSKEWPAADLASEAITNVAVNRLGLRLDDDQRQEFLGQIMKAYPELIEKARMGDDDENLAALDELEKKIQGHLESGEPPQAKQPSAEQANAEGVAQRLRVALTSSFEGDTHDMCIASAKALQKIFPDAEIWAGEYQGEEHVVSKLGGQFIDVTSDQFGGPEIFVGEELPRDYTSFRKLEPHELEFDDAQSEKIAQAMQGGQRLAVEEDESERKRKAPAAHGAGVGVFTQPGDFAPEPKAAAADAGKPKGKAGTRAKSKDKAGKGTKAKDKAGKGRHHHHRRLPRGLRLRSQWRRLGKKPAEGTFGMIKGLWHGPTPPSPEWKLVQTGKRGGKIWAPPAGMEPKQRQRVAPRGKTPKGDPAAIAEAMRKAINRGLTDDAVQKLTPHIMTMRVVDIQALKKELGLKASGTKAELVAKFLQHAKEASERVARTVPEARGAEIAPEAVTPLEEIDRTAPIQERIKSYRVGDQKVAKLARLHTRETHWRNETDRLNGEITKVHDYVRTLKGARMSKGNQEKLNEIKQSHNEASREYWAARNAIQPVLKSMLKAGIDNPLEIDHEVHDPDGKWTPKQKPEELKGEEGWTSVGTKEGLGGAMHQSIKQAVDFYEGILQIGNQEDIFKIQILPVPDGEDNRAYYMDVGGQFGGQAFLSRNDEEFTAIAIHELGHHCEYNLKGAHEACDEFLNYRRKGEKPQRYIDLFPNSDYKPHEKGIKDEFDKAFEPWYAWYVGKIYDHPSTEILSMGIEKLYRDPAGFAAKDPEYCKFVLGILDGSLRGMPEGEIALSPPGQAQQSPEEGGGAGEPATPEGRAQAIQHVGDSAISALQEQRKQIQKLSIRKQRDQVLPLHDEHAAKINSYFDDLASKITTDKEANDIAKAMGYQAVTGNKDKVLKTLRQKTLDRIGSFIRPYA